MLNAQRLEWDSEFFDFGVGRLVGPFESRPTLAAERGLYLVYGVCGHEDTASHHSLSGRIAGCGARGECGRPHHRHDHGQPLRETQIDWTIRWRGCDVFLVGAPGQQRRSLPRLRALVIV
jgi:hypothetical protein